MQQRYGDRVGVVVNRSDKSAEIGSEDIEKAVGVKISHVFPNDYRQAVAAINKGQPLAESTQGRLPESFQVFAQAITGLERPDDSRRSRAAAAACSGWLTPKRSLSS